MSSFSKIIPAEGLAENVNQLSIWKNAIVSIVQNFNKIT